MLSAAPNTLTTSHQCIDAHCIPFSAFVELDLETCGWHSIAATMKTNTCARPPCCSKTGPEESDTYMLYDHTSALQRLGLVLPCRGGWPVIIGHLAASLSLDASSTHQVVTPKMSPDAV